MHFALNRLDLRGPAQFAASAARAEALGWHMGLIPCSPLLVQDPYVCLALAAETTSSIALGTLLDTPVLRHPAVLASSIATVAGLAPGRTHLGLGSGDTAVRLNGLAPATVAALGEATRMTRRLLAGAAIELGAARPARLRHARPVPVWIAAQGPKTLRMAGATADGVWIRVGTHPDNLRAAWDAVLAGARDAGRDPGEIRLGLIFHTAYDPDRERARCIARAIAAGYYEYSTFLFRGAGIEWNGENVHSLRKRLWPDFHHHHDLLEAGRLVGFLPREAADAFALHGDWPDIAAQLAATLERAALPVSVVLPHPMLAPGNDVDYPAACADRLISRFT